MSKRFRVMASGDDHFCEHVRFEECIRVHAWKVELARELGIDLYVNGGDIYERESSIPEREAAKEFVVKMGEICPELIAKGNHDADKDLRILGALKTRHPIIVEERAGVHLVAGAAVAAMAWPERATILADLGDREATDQVLRDSLRNILRGLGDQMAEHDGPRILLGHFMADGAITSTGQPLLGQPINVGLADLALARPHVGFMSHIHKAQRWTIDGVPFAYPGSPFRTDYGQREKKIVLVAEFEGSRLVDLVEYETPATPMIHARGTYERLAPDSEMGRLFGDGLIDLDPESVDEIDETPGAEIRVRYRVAPEDQAAAEHAADRLRNFLFAERGAAAVKLEREVIVTKRAKAPEVARAVLVTDKIREHWKARGIDPGERRDAVLAKVTLLEEECRDTA